MSRIRIEEFCRTCIARQFKLQLPIHCRQELLQIHVEFTRDGFESEFKQLCESVLFECANPLGRVIALLWYARVLRQRYQIWWSDDICVSVLTDVLEKVNFDPDDVKPPSSCIVL